MTILGAGPQVECADQHPGRHADRRRRGSSARHLAGAMQNEPAHGLPACAPSSWSRKRVLPALLTCVMWA